MMSRYESSFLNEMKSTSLICGTWLYYLIEIVQKEGRDEFEIAV